MYVLYKIDLETGTNACVVESRQDRRCTGNDGALLWVAGWIYFMYVCDVGAGMNIGT